MGEYDEELTELLKLRTVKRIGSTISFEKARRIVRSKKLNYITEYNELCERDNRIPRDPESFFERQFIDWIDYLGISRDKYYDFVACKNAISDYLTKYPNLKEDYLDLAKKMSTELRK